MRLLQKVFTVLILFFIGLGFVASINAKDKLVIDFFYSKTCPHCSKEKLFLKKLEGEYEDLQINRYLLPEPESIEKIIEVGKKLNIDIGAVPLTVIGEKYWIGYRDVETTGMEIENEVNKKLGINEAQVNKKKKGIDFESLSLPVMTLVVGVLDGFNPCAMWVLLFLISLLLNMKDRKKMWILGSVFIVSSAVMYFLVMTAWLNLFLILGMMEWIRFVIGMFALGTGFYCLYKWQKNKDGGCDIVDDKKREKMFSKMRSVVSRENLGLAIIGMIGLAIIVNLVELACSAGLPAVYTEVLAMNNLAIWKYYLYILVYVIIFMIDDFLIFIIAMISLKAVGVDSKYSRWSKLVGGILMLGIGLAMLFKPELLSFG